ncbi:Endoribonuclease YbeY [bioreactor metagenome]|uniref:Endoribonuclease YbeY n=1 Tax=bioreactor metagenome TaxID=1076179 RepID=A0A645C7I1_9ZZZZ
MGKKLKNNKINIFNESIRQQLPTKRILETVNKMLVDANVDSAVINIIFVNNKEIKKINKEYLEHNYATDVISFCLEDTPLEGEIYISAEIAKSNAIEYKTTWTEELMRYVIHGVLHLLGYEDFSLLDREKMRNLEDKYLTNLLI